MSTEKIYVGKLTQRVNNFNEPETKIWFGPQDFEKLDKVRQEKGDNANLVIKLSKEGKPYMIVDNWEPNKVNNWEPKKAAVAAEPTGEDTDLPF